MKRIDEHITERPLRRLLNGAVILTMAALVSKILSAGYRIPYHYIAGDVGFYIYQQIYPFYGLAVLFSTYGFPVIISKLIAQEMGKGRRESVFHIVKVSFTALLLLNVLLFSIQYGAAEQIADLMGDAQLTNLIKIVSFSFLLTPFIAVARGYYQGQNNMIPTAVSQVVEQTVRVSAILVFSYSLLSKGYGVYKAGAGAIAGSVAGGFASLAVLLFFLSKHQGGLFFTKSKGVTVQTKKILQALFIQGTLISISSMGILLIQFIDSFTLYAQLVENGLDEHAAKSIKGIYDRGLPLIQLGTVVGTAFSLSLVPVISAAIVKKDYSLLKEKTELSIRLSFVVGVGAVLGLIGIMEPTNIMLYGDVLGTGMLRVFCVMILFTTLVAASAAILQGMDHAGISALTMVAGMVVKWVLNMVLIPAYSTTGAAVSSVVSFALIAVMNNLYLYKKLGFPVIKGRTLWLTFKAGAGMLLVLLIYKEVWQWISPSLLERNWRVVWEALSGVAVGGLFYGWMILRNHLFTKEEVLKIPYGDKLSKWMKS
ncbi:oligosaccharide flippase family protein [Bacillus songklensis]|uniref:Oligosaccharide flippase family protein n=1 Tax=Bacillus songklensis TaxID=1069116 RepID=A0ABV8AVS3_9BACI